METKSCSRQLAPRCSRPYAPPVKRRPRASNRLFPIATSLLLSAVGAPAADCPPLAERLGYKATDKLLIVNGDDVGMCHSANLATIESLETGAMRSSTIMVPCPWFPEIA